MAAKKSAGRRSRKPKNFMEKQAVDDRQSDISDDVDEKLQSVREQLQESLALIKAALLKTASFEVKRFALVRSAQLGVQVAESIRDAGRLVDLVLEDS